MFKFLIASVLAFDFAFALDLNSASTKELMGLGLSKSEALNIIKYRRAHKFKNIDELYKVQGLSGDKANKIKNSVSVASKTKRPTKTFAKNVKNNTKKVSKNLKNNGKNLLKLKKSK